MERTVMVGAALILDPAAAPGSWPESAPGMARESSRCLPRGKAPGKENSRNSGGPSGHSGGPRRLEGVWGRRCWNPSLLLSSLPPSLPPFSGRSHFSSQESQWEKLSQPGFGNTVRCGWYSCWEMGMERENTRQEHMSLPGMSKKSTIRSRTIMAAQAGVSDTMEVTKATHMPVIICINSTDTKSPLWIFEKPREFDDYIGIVESEDPSKSVHFKEKYKTHFDFCVRGRVLRISPLRMKDFGTYSVKKSGKTSIFTLQTNKTMVNCKVHGSHRSCSCYLHYSPPDASFGNVSCTWDQRRYILQVNESSQNLLEMLMYRSQNTVTVTTPGVLRNGTQSDSIIAWSVASVLVLILLTFLRFICKLKCECGKPSLEPWGAGAVYCRKKRRRGSAGSQHDSHSAAGDHMIDIKRQAEESV